MSPKKWINATNAIGIVSKAGRYGGTYAHSDIAMSFATWISPEFQLYIMKDYRRLKTDENSRLSLNWNLNWNRLSVKLPACYIFTMFKLVPARLPIKRAPYRQEASTYLYPFAFSIWVAMFSYKYPRLTLSRISFRSVSQIEFTTKSSFLFYAFPTKSSFSNNSPQK